MLKIHEVHELEPENSFTVAESHYRAGQLPDAAKILDQILLQDPLHFPSNYLRGVISYRMKDYVAAEKFIHITLEQPSDHKYVHYKLMGDILRDQGKLTDAIEPYQKAIALKDDYFDVLHNLGTIELVHKNYEAAKNYYKRVFDIRPDYTLSLFSMGIACEALAQYEEAKEYYLKAISSDPKFVSAYLNLGNVLNILGLTDEATKYYTLSLSLKPTAQAHNALGIMFHTSGNQGQALAHYKSAIELQPDNAEALNNLGSLYSHSGLFENACTLYERVLSIQPDHPEALNNLGNILRHLGQPDKAVACYKRSLRITPDNAQTYSNLLMTMLYAPTISADELAEAAKNFGLTIADTLLRTRPFLLDKNPERKLRIGYVSPDFREHAVNYFFESLLTLHNRDQFVIFAYSNATNEDDVTSRVRNKFDRWRDIRKIDDDTAATMIENDKIDILVDLAGHTGNNRLLIFARKPAPIQVTWLGYPATTGLKAIDYRITDHYAEPEGMTEYLNTETLWRLPQIFCCYGGHVKNPDVINHPPHVDNGYITFGCFNNFSKVGDAVLLTWKKILEQVPNSRLLLEIAGLDGAEFRAELDKRFAALKMPIDRIILESRKKENQFVLYNKIDISLDPFPCVGGTTSMDTMWMGVPLITLAGHHFVSRMGVTILTNVGLAEFIAQNTDEYVEKAVALANDPNRLKAIRHNLRDKVVASPMMDQVQFARNMENAYRDMWRKWCSENPSGSQSHD